MVISNTNMDNTKCTFTNTAAEGSTEIPQLTYIPQLLEGNIQYQYIFRNMDLCCQYHLLVLEIYPINKGVCEPYRRRLGEFTFYNT